MYSKRKYLSTTVDDETLFRYPEDKTLMVVFKFQRKFSLSLPFEAEFL